MIGRTNLVLFSVFAAVLAIFALLALVLPPSFRTTLDVLAIGVLWGVALFPLLTRPELRHNPFHPLSWLLVNIILFYAVRAVVVEVTNRMELGFPNAPTAMGQLALGCIMIAASIGLYLLGYSWRLGADLARSAPLFSFEVAPQQQRPLISRALLLYAVGWISRLYYFLVLGVAQIRWDQTAIYRFKSLMDDVASFCQLSLVAVAILVWRRQAPRTTLVLLILGEMVYALMGGQRSYFIYPFLLVTLAYSYYRKPIRWSEVAAAALLVIFVVAPVLSLYKDAYRQAIADSGSGQFHQKLVTSAIAGAQERSGETPFEEVVGAVSDRFGGIEGLLLVLQAVSDGLPLQHGATFLPNLEVAFIPRILWPNKPDLTLNGRLFAQVFHGDTNMDRIGVMVSIGNVAELYWNFGFWGMLLLPMYGIFTRFFWERMKYYFQVERCAGVRMPFFFSVVDVQGDITGYVSGVPRAAMGYYLYMVLLYGRLPKITWLQRPARTQERELMPAVATGYARSATRIAPAHPAKS